jgi:hypothetical protein
LLDDAVAAFLNSVTERAFDEPFLALLRAKGFTDVTLTHGQEEFGKDAVARRRGEQWAFQSKAGNIGQPQWRGLTGQLEELRLSDYAGPEFDPRLPRRPVLVTTGRLVGNAPLLASEYNNRARERGEPELEVWTRDRLGADLVGSPSAILRGSIDGGLLTLVGAIERRDVSMGAVEAFARRWDTFPADKLVGLGIIEAGLVCDRLSAAQRDDLACHLALCLVRAAWAGAQDERTALLVADAGGALFETYARQLWGACTDELLRKRGTLALDHSPSVWATYPVRCQRIAELLGLLGLRVRISDERLAAEIASWLARFITAQPGCAHPLGDRYAVACIPPCLLLARYKPHSARRLLTKTAVWLCDQYERSNFGLASSAASPADEIKKVFGTAFEHVPLKKRRTSQLGAVLLDVAAILKLRSLYADIHNDLVAVRLSPMVLRCSDSPDQYSMVGDSNRWEINPAYPAEISTSISIGLPHHEEDADRQLIGLGRPWDLLGVSSALRDRHFVSAIRAFAT